jgi:hypothetical protein
MPEMGHSRRSDGALITSGLPRLADIFRVRRHVSRVHKRTLVISKRLIEPLDAADLIAKVAATKNGQRAGSMPGGDLCS